MTTIAYRDGKLAADTQITYHGGIKGITKKIDILPDGRVLACAGDVVAEYWFKQLIQGVKIPKEKHKFKELEAIVIDGDKAYVCWGSPELIELNDNYLSIGHGATIARAGMAIGLSAKEAVMMAGEVDIYTNKVIDVYDAKRKKITYGK